MALTLRPSPALAPILRLLVTTMRDLHEASPASLSVHIIECTLVAEVCALGPDDALALANAICEDEPIHIMSREGPRRRMVAIRESDIPTHSHPRSERCTATCAAQADTLGYRPTISRYPDRAESRRRPFPVPTEYVDPAAQAGTCNCGEPSGSRPGDDCRNCGYTLTETQFRIL